METVKKPNVCLKCGSDFVIPSSLRRHVRKFHPEEIDSLAPLKNRDSQNFLFPCSLCKRNFNKKKHLTFHMKTHAVSPVAPTTESDTNVCKERGEKTTIGNSETSRTSNNALKCPLCDYSVSLRRQILQHFQDSHQIEICCTQMEFDSLSAFNEWKEQIERTSNAKFIIQKSDKCKERKTMVYACHRSGYFVSKGRGLRRLKSRGSEKINAYCPASIRKVEHLNKNNDVKKVEICYTETHVGHQPDIEHLLLTKTERQKIAAKIASKACFDEILDEIRDSIPNEELKRLHLATKKDLYNIRQSFNLTASSAGRPNDAISVDAFLNQMRLEEDCILFYKPQGVVCEEKPNLRKADFVLILMNQAQAEFLTKYGSDCVCLDETHGLNNHNYELNTLIVLDDMREGFPAAYMISNRSDSDVLKLFLSEIKAKVGVVTPNIFMSNVANWVYDAWISVMGVPQERFFCCWHVDHAWRKNLPLIKGRENQVTIYKQLRALLEERDSSAFEIFLKKICGNSNPDLERFVGYFKEHYFNDRQHWAYCYLPDAVINANMELERSHRTIKYAYSKGRLFKKLDKGIDALMTLTRNRLIDRLTSTDEGNISDNSENVPERHENVDSTSNTQVEHDWELPPAETQEIQIPREFQKSCNYKLICSQCNACIQEYGSSCSDSATTINLCKHVHLIAETSSGETIGIVNI